MAAGLDAASSAIGTASSRMERSAFRYTKLDSPSHQIRLLSFTWSSKSDNVRCKLQVLNVDDAPGYHAISYTWGDPVTSRTIFIDGLSVAVRENCYYALWQAQNYRMDMHYWIDAICINQDDLEEKSEEVAMMGAIYARATLVLACIGHHYGDSQFFFERAPQSHQIYERVRWRSAVLDDWRIIQNA